ADAESVLAPVDAAPVPPSEAGRPKSTDAETNAALKTPATAPKAAAKNAKAAQEQPVSGTAAAEPAPAVKAEAAAAKPSLADKNRP
ncbi:NADH dehydrogenase subunit E, partial [Pseudomonas sp. BGM005]|nr:NADH dehydrogenase subunit E [Pseudomonas sp. BG5]